MARKKPTYKELIELAKQYGVDNNVMFTTSCERYAMVTNTIKEMREAIDQEGVLINRINVKGDTNMDTNPLVPQLPKYVEVANKTLTTMLDIIQRLGMEKQVERFGDLDD